MYCRCMSPWECVIYVLGPQMKVSQGLGSQVVRIYKQFILSVADVCVYLSNCSLKPKFML